MVCTGAECGGNPQLQLRGGGACSLGVMAHSLRSGRGGAGQGGRAQVGRRSKSAGRWAVHGLTGMAGAELVYCGGLLPDNKNTEDVRP